MALGSGVGKRTRELKDIEMEGQRGLLTKAQRTQSLIGREPECQRGWNPGSKKDRTWRLEE